MGWVCGYHGLPRPSDPEAKPGHTSIAVGKHQLLVFAGPVIAANRS